MQVLPRPDPSDVIVVVRKLVHHQSYRVFRWVHGAPSGLLPDARVLELLRNVVGHLPHGGAQVEKHRSFKAVLHLPLPVLHLFAQDLEAVLNRRTREEVRSDGAVGHQIRDEIQLSCAKVSLYSS